MSSLVWVVLGGLFAIALVAFIGLLVLGIITAIEIAKGMGDE